MGVNASHLKNQNKQEDVLASLIGRAAFDVESTDDKGNRKILRFSYSGKVQNGKAVWTAGGIPDTISLAATGSEVSWVYKHNEESIRTHILGTVDSQEVIQAIIPPAGAALGPGTDPIVLHNPTFIATFKILQYPFPTRLLRLRRRGPTWGIPVKELAEDDAVRGYRVYVSRNPEHLSPLQVNDILIEINGISYNESGHSSLQYTKFVQTARHPDIRTMFLLVAKREDMENKHLKRDCPEEIADLERRLAEATLLAEKRRTDKERAPIEAVLRPKDFYVSKGSTETIYPWYKVPATLEGQTQVHMVSAKLTFLKNRGAPPSLRVRCKNTRGWARLGAPKVLDTDQLEYEIPVAFLSSGLELAIARSEGVADADMNITGAQLTVTLGTSKRTELTATDTRRPQPTYPFTTRLVKCRRSKSDTPWGIPVMELIVEEAVMGYRLELEDAAASRAYGLQPNDIIIEIDGRWLLDVPDQHAELQRYAARPTIQLDLLVAAKDDILLHELEGPPTYVLPPTYEEVMLWPDFADLPAYSSFVAVQ